MGLLFLAFVLVPFVELYLLVRIGRVVGAGNTLAFVVVMGLLGAYLAKHQGSRVIREWRDALSQGQVPAEGVLGGALVLLGGLLLITPGVLTDFLGLFLLLPWTRKVIAGLLRGYLQRQLAAGRIQFYSMGGMPGAPSPRPRQTEIGRGPGQPGDVIDTEGEEVH